MADKPKVISLAEHKKQKAKAKEAEIVRRILKAAEKLPW